ncbi:MAG: flagellar basal-body rod protein FlgF [Ignavibacteriaceae bacterium]
MIKGIYTAARGLDARMKNLEVIANNLANLNTTGFKKEMPFSEVMNQYGQTQIQQVTDFRQGDLAQTNNPTDVAISGKGFFVVQTENGQELTRNGSFKISDNGYLVDQQGNKVMGQNGAIKIDMLSFEKQKSFTISNNGEVKFGNNVIDSLMIAKMNDQQDSARDSGTNFSAVGGFQVANQNDFQIKQGYLEESNVNPIKELENMIQVNNEYQSASKMITFLDKSLDEANQIGKV